MAVERFLTSLKEKYLQGIIGRHQFGHHLFGRQQENTVELSLVKLSRRGVYNSAQQRGREKARKVAITVEDLFEKGQRSVTLVEGDAGMGKSTFCNILSDGWAKGGHFAETFDLVLFLLLRDKEVANAESISDVLMSIHRDKGVCDAVAQHLVKVTEGRGLLVLLDGWDELPASKRQQDSFYSSLLCGKPLPFASVIVTSRQSASIELHRVENIDHFVVIDGFTEESMQKFIELEFAGDEESGIDLVRNLEQNPTIRGLCMVPLNCSIVCYLWKVTRGNLPPTMTELYSNLIMNIVLPDTGLKTISSFDVLPENPWKFVCELAYQGLRNEQVIFSEEELKQLFPDSEGQFACFNLLQRIETSLSVGTGVTFHFLHLTFQEYLAALHLATKDPAMQLEHVRSICLMPIMPDYFQSVMKFFFGLISGRSMVSKGIHPLTKDLWSLFSEIVCSRGLSRLPSYTFSPDLLFCHCAYEAGNKFIDARVTKLFSGSFQGLFTCSIQDCSSVAYVIARSLAYCPLSLKLYNCSLTDTHLKILLDPLKKAYGKLQVQELNLDRNLLSIESLHVLVRSSKSFSNLERLSFECSKDVEPKSPDFVQYFLQSLPKSLCHLSLNGIILSPSTIQAFTSVIQNGQLSSLKRLRLNNTLDGTLNDQLVCTFFSSLQQSCPRLTLLDLSHNVLDAPSAKVLGSVAQKLEQLDCLDLDDAGISNLGILEFLSDIKYFPGLERLSLKNNQVQSSGMAELCKMISTAMFSPTILDISHNQLGVSGAHALSEALKSECCLLETLNVENCGFLSEGCLSVVLALSRSSSLEIVKLEHNICARITAESASQPELLPLSAESLGENKSIKMMSLSNNHFTSSNVLIIAVSILGCPAMTFLDCSRCSIDSAALKKLFEAFDRLKTSQAIPSVISLEVFDLRSNSIDDSGVATILLNLHHFPKLVNVFLERNHVSSEMMETLITKLRERSMVRQIKMLIHYHIYSCNIGS